MTGKIRVASWLLRHIGPNADSEVMLGDILERLSWGKSQFWFWREVASLVLTTTFEGVLSNGGLMMKRTIIWAIVVAAVFSLGYWTARSPLLIRQEMPSQSEIAEMHFRRQIEKVGREQIAKEREQDVKEWLTQALYRAESEYRQTGTAESKAKLNAVRRELEGVQRITIGR